MREKYFVTPSVEALHVVILQLDSQKIVQRELRLFH